jgi:hypothetical protein
VLAKIGTLPPLVTRNEVRLAPCKACKSYHDHIQIERLRFQLSLVQRNEAFLLHAGDCAESFDACTHVSCVTCIPNINMLKRHCRSGEHLRQNWTNLVILFDFDLERSFTHRALRDYSCFYGYSGGAFPAYRIINVGSHRSHCWSICQTAKFKHRKNW